MMQCLIWVCTVCLCPIKKTLGLYLIMKAVFCYQLPHLMRVFTGPHDAVDSESDCRSRGHKFDPSSVPYFLGIDCEIISTVILFLPLN